MVARLEENLDQLTTHPGQEVVWERDSLQRALAIFFTKSDTFLELLESLKTRLNSSQQVLHSEHNDQFTEAAHDFFSASYSVYAKAQRLQSKLYCNCDSDRCSPDRCNEFKSYHAKLEETGLLQMGTYINTLRVIAEKIATPNLLAATRYNIFRTDPRLGVVLDRNRLLEWCRAKRNRNTVVRYLEESKQAKIDVKHDITEYSSALETFYGWLFSDISEKYAHELRDRRRMIQNYRDDP